MLGTVLTGKGGGGLGGTYNYDELKNIPIINQDLSAGEIEAVNPIEVGETINKLYLNLDVEPDFSKIDWSDLDDEYTDEATGAKEEYVVILDGGEGEVLAVNRIIFNSSTAYAILGRFEDNKYDGMVYLQGMTDEIADAIDMDWEYMGKKNGWLITDSEQAAVATVSYLEQQDIWSGWISKDGQWQKNAYKGEAGNYYRNIGEDTIRPINPIEVGETINKLYFNTSVTPDFTKVDWSEAVVEDDGQALVVAQSNSDSEYPIAIYKMPAGTEVESDIVTVVEADVWGLVAAGTLVYGNPEYFRIVELLGNTELRDGFDANGWIKNGYYELDSSGVAYNTISQQDIWGAWISKDGKWTESSAFKSGGIYYYDGTDYTLLDGNYYTKEEVGGIIDGINERLTAVETSQPDMTNYYTSSQVEELVQAEAVEREVQDNVLKNDIATETTDRIEADTALDERISALETSGGVDLSNYYTKAETDTAISSAIASTITTALNTEV